MIYLFAKSLPFVFRLKKACVQVVCRFKRQAFLKKLLKQFCAIAASEAKGITSFGVLK